MTAPDPGLTDLIAAALVRSSPNSIDTFDLLPHHRQEAWRVRAREVALVVEQHTNGRMARLREHVEELAARGLPADLNPTTLGDGDGDWWRAYLRLIDSMVRDNARAALEGEQ